MRHSLHRTLPLLAIAGIGWLFWSAGRRDTAGPAGYLPKPRRAEADSPGPNGAPVTQARPKAISSAGPNKLRAAKAANSSKPAKGFEPVRQAGPSQMKDPPRHWDRVDEEIDESFPASDPPARY